MLSFKSNSPVQPIYDFYVETDVDSLDDQPIDYSKRYADQDSYEERRRKKSAAKSNQYSTPETAAKTDPRNYTDEVKIYCMEGTPVTISSASSFCDLRSVGEHNSAQKSSLKPNLPSLNDDDNPSDSYESKKSDESEGNIKDLPSPRDKDENSKEAKSVSFRNSEDISKASSPMMFSRSSSLGSLTSFEQQSGADDRSSVSAYSALTSGIISPSDLPDSPGDLMPSALSNKSCHSKISTFKDDSDKEYENEDLCDKESTLPRNVPGHENSSVSVTQRQISKPEEYMPLMRDLSDRSSIEEGNDILDQQFELMHDSSADLDEVFTDPDIETDGFVLKSERDSVDQLSEDESDEGDMMLQQCIQLGMANSNSSDKYSALKDQEQQSNVPQQKSLVVKENLEVFDSNVCHQSLQTKILDGKSVECAKKFYQPESMTGQNLDMLQPKSDMQKNASSASESDSDADNDELLQHCIEMGMPTKSMNNQTELERFGKSECMPQQVAYNLASSPVKFDDDDSDEDDLLQQCIQLGMPSNSPENRMNSQIYEQKPISSIPPKKMNQQVNASKECSETNSSYLQKGAFASPNHLLCQMRQKMPPIKNAGMDPEVSQPLPRHVANVPLKFEDDESDDDGLLQQCIQLGRPNKSSGNKADSSAYQQRQNSNVPNQHINAQVLLKYEDEDSDDDGLLQQCIQLGRPNKSSGNKTDSHSYQQRNNSNILHQNTNSQAPSKEQFKRDSTCIQKCAFVSQNHMMCGMQQKMKPNRIAGVEHGISQSCQRNIENVPLKYEHDDGLLPHCIQLGRPSKSSENKTDIHLYQQRNSLSIPHQSQNIQMKALKDLAKMNSNSLHRGAFVSQNHMLCGMQQKMMPNRNAQLEPGISQPLRRNFDNVPLKYEDDESDDDGILQQCIQLGRPNKSFGNKSDSYMYQQRKNSNVSHRNINTQMGSSNDPSKMNLSCLQKGAFVSQSHCQSGLQEQLTSNRSAGTQHRICQSHARNTENVPLQFDGESDDDGILQQCIQLGRPNKSSGNKSDSYMCHQRKNANISHQNINTQMSFSNDPSTVNASCFQKLEFVSPNHNLNRMQQKLPSNRTAGTENGICQSHTRNTENALLTFYDDDSDDDGLLQQCIQRGLPNKSSGNDGDSYLYHQRTNSNALRQSTNDQDRRDDCPDGVSDGDEDNDILKKCIRAGMPSPKTTNDVHNRLLIPQSHCSLKKNQQTKKLGPLLPSNQTFAPIQNTSEWVSSTSFIDVDSMMVYRTEDTPILSPSHSISDLSSLSFNESFLNNSRNSNCSSESEDDELLLQCIRSGMPEARRAVA